VGTWVCRKEARVPIQAHRLCGFGRARIDVLGAVLVVALIAVAASAAGARTGPASDASIAQQFSLDHFLCYTVDPGSFRPRRVRVADQFGRRSPGLLRIELLCTPVSKNRGVVRNPRAHLVCYRENRQASRNRGVIVTNQLGRFRGTVRAPVRLCLPSGKRPGATVPPPARGLDHYACYALATTTQPRPRRFALRDQFGSMTVAVGRNATLCAPASKNASRVLNRRDHLTCVTIAAPEFRPLRVSYTNQFVRGDLLTVIRPVLLCVPTLKRVVVVRPDLTVTISAPPIVSCPGGGGTCTTTVSFTISNPSATAVSAPFQVLVEADPGQSKTISVAGLAAGASQSFAEVLGPGGNCFDPDCTVRVTVDSGNAIAESNETNNVATTTNIG
jgi:CARDB